MLVVLDTNIIVSGDKRHILSLGQAEGIPIITARKAVEMFIIPPATDPPKP